MAKVFTAKDCTSNEYFNFFSKRLHTNIFRSKAEEIISLLSSVTATHLTVFLWPFNTASCKFSLRFHTRTVQSEDPDIR